MVSQVLGVRPTRGRYRPIAELGRGGMATAYLCVAQGPGGFNKLQVLKYLRPDLAADEEFLTMFLEEARIAARINHPNVVQTNEVGYDGICHYIAMEYIEGQTIENVVRRAKKQGNKSIPLDMHLRILSDALAGLHHAHELLDFDGTPLNIVHRDVSPHNVMVTYDGFVKVLDFGIAKAADSSSDTRSGMLKGKYAYMAPEQYSGDRVDRRADIFAMGVMLWQAITSQRMWKGITGTEIIARVIKGDIKRPSELVADVDERLEAICMKALAHDPDARYATAADFQSALEDHLRARSILILSRDVGQYVGNLAVESRSRIRAAVEAQLAKTSEQTSADIPVLWLTAPEASRSGEVPPHTTTSSNAHQVGSAAPTEAFEPKRRSQRILLGAAGLMVLVLCFAGIAFWPSRTSPAAAIATQPHITAPLPTAPPTVASVEAVPSPPASVSTAAAPSSAPAGLVANAQPPGVGGHGYYRIAPKASTTIVPSANTASTKPRTGSDTESIGGRE
jgi:eukaryotic-like serine/threonine-protein kinase